MVGLVRRRKAADFTKVAGQMLELLSRYLANDTWFRDLAYSSHLMGYYLSKCPSNISISQHTILYQYIGVSVYHSTYFNYISNFSKRHHSFLLNKNVLVLLEHNIYF